MVQKYTAIILLALSLGSGQAQSKATNASITFGAAKAAIEGIKAYAYASNKEQIKRSYPDEASTWSTMKREALEVCCDYAINLALEAMSDNTLCHGKDTSNFINTHKYMAILVSETAKLMASSSGVTKGKLAVNVTRKLLENDGAFTTNSHGQKTIAQATGIVAGFLNGAFYKDLEVGKINFNELKNLGGKYLTVQGGIEALSIAYASKTLPGYAESWNNPIQGKNFENHHKKFVVDLIMVVGRQAIFKVSSFAKEAYTKYTTKSPEDNANSIAS